MTEETGRDDIVGRGETMIVDEAMFLFEPHKEAGMVLDLPKWHGGTNAKVELNHVGVAGGGLPVDWRLDTINILGKEVGCPLGYCLP